MGQQGSRTGTRALSGRLALLAPLYFFVFATGAAGLIYQVAWQKYLGRIMGSDTISTAVIMCTFLGGLSIGYYLCGRLSVRMQNHLKAYALLEAVIAAWCLLFPKIFSGMVWLTDTWSFEPPFLMILQGVLGSFLLTGVPTICMGATVPLLTRGISASVREATGVHARIYGINTAGAFLGTLLAGFWLLPVFGLPLTTMGTAVINLAAAGFFYLVSIVAPPQEATQPGEAGQQPTVHTAGARRKALPRTFLYLIVLLSGFYVMTLENVLIRVTNLSFGSSSYSFSLVLSVFLLAIAIGSLVVGRMRSITPRTLYLNQLAITLLLLLLYLSLSYWPYIAHLLRVSFQSNPAGLSLYYFFTFLSLMLVLLLPLSFAGATLPITFHEIKQDLRNLGRHSGLLLSWNTVGNLSGSLVGGVILFYVIDMPEVFLVGVLLAAISSLLAAQVLPRLVQAATAGLVLLVLGFLLTTPGYDFSHFVKGTFRIREATRYSFEGIDHFYAAFLGEGGLLYYKDGPACSVAVIDWKTSRSGEGQGGRAVMVNGKSDSSTIGDIHTLKLSAHIPAILAARRSSALVIGLGTGVTAGELALYSEFEHIDVAEISPMVVEALPLFDDYNGAVRKDPRMHMHVGDAFRVLARSRRTWDLVISEPSNPWVTGVDMLFSQDFYRLARSHISPGGVFLQWAQIYAASPSMLGMIANTLRRQFKEVHVFLASSGDLLFLASNDEIDRERILQADRVLAQNAAVRESLATLGIESLDAILLRQIWTTSIIKDFFAHCGVQTLDNPRLHYLAGRDFFYGKEISLEAFFPGQTSFYHREYLLSRLLPDWSGKAISGNELDSLLRSATTSLTGKATPMRAHIKLKAYLADPEAVQLSASEKRDFGVDLIRLLGDADASEQDWARIGLGEATPRRRAESLLEHMHAVRSWIVPFPIGGLEALLRHGMDTEIGARKNWFVVQLAKLLQLDRASPATLRSVLDAISLDPQGVPLLSPQERIIIEAIERHMQEG